MRCDRCKATNPESNSFCFGCGIELSPVEEYSVSELGEQLRSLRLQVNEIKETLVSRHVSIDPIHNEDDSQTESKIVDGIQESVGASNEDEIQGPSSSLRLSWESFVGGNWLARVGVFAVVIGTAFLLKLVVDNEWVDETGLIVLGVLSGLVFLILGEMWQGRYQNYAQALLGGGIGILYLTMFAGFAAYEFINFYISVMILLLISTLSAGIALRHGSMALAIIGVLGAFSAPFVLSGLNDALGQDRYLDGSALITYIILVDFGVLALSMTRNWRWLTLLALIGSSAAYLAWYDTYGNETSLFVAQVGVTIIFLSLVGATTLFHFVWRKIPKRYDFTLMILNGAMYFGITYTLIWDEFQQWMGLFTLILAVFYAGLGYLAFRRNRDQPNLSLMLLGLAAVFLAVVVPVQFRGPWVSIGWATYGTVLIWIAYRLRMKDMETIGVAVLLAMLVRLLLVESQVNLNDFQPVVNTRVLAFTVGILALSIYAYLIKRYPEANYAEIAGIEHSVITKWHHFFWEFLKPNRLFSLLLLLANFLVLWVCSSEIVSTVDSDIVDAGHRIEGHIKSLALSLFWGLYASAFLVIGIVGRWPHMRLAALVLLGVPVVKLFLVDTFQLDQEFRVAAFLLMGLMMLIGGYLYQRYGVQIRGFLLEDK